MERGNLRPGCQPLFAILGIAALVHPWTKREKFKQRTCENESTNARYRDGKVRSSEEALVMRVERRDFVIQF